MKKISFYFLLIIFFVSCNSTKHVTDGEHMLNENYIFIDSLKTKGAELQKYILQKPNPRFLGLPIALYFHNIGNHNKPETPIKWAIKNPRSYNFVKTIFSEKQSISYANSFIKLNNWFLDYDEPEIINDLKISRTADNLWAYYKTQGYFKSSVNSTINIDSIKKKATVAYYIKKGKATLLDTIKFKINSLVLDSIYKTANIETFLKTGDQYKDVAFRNEANTIVKLFRNSGI
ncbi:MAG: hypothetical protein ACI9Q3_001291, partial [Maribacter sp.]